MTHHDSLRPEPGLERRTLVAGAAWTIPVVSAAIGAPLAAASTALQLTFSAATYASTACSTIAGASVLATVDGVPAAGRPFGVTLSGGYTFADGTTAFSGSSGPDGSVSLPAIRVPAHGGEGLTIATSDSMTASAALSAPVVTGGFGVLLNGELRSTPAVPAGSSPLYGGWFRTPDDRIVDENGVVVGADVDLVGQGFQTDAGWYLPLRLTTGGFGVYINGVWHPAPNVPSGSTPLYGGWFRTADDRIVDQDGVVVGADVDLVGQGFQTDAGWWLPLRLTDGSFGYYLNGVWNTAPSVPAGSTPLYGGWFRTSDDRIVDHDGTVVGADVDVVGDGFQTDAGWYLPLRLKNGSFGYYLNGTWNAAPAVPAGSTPLYGGWFRTPDDRIVAGDDGSTVVSGIDSVGQGFETDAGFKVPVRLQPTACSWS